MKPTRFKTRWIRAAVFVYIIVLGGCKKDSPAKPSTPGTPGADQIFIESSAFNPDSITVPVNTTITWTNKDNVAHNVTSVWFNSPTLNAGDTYSRQFTKAGTYAYQSTLPAVINGTVIVE